MKIPLALHKFKKVHVDETHTTLASPDGHEIKVAHAALKPAVRAQLHELPLAKAMADGGEAEEDEKPRPHMHMEGFGPPTSAESAAQSGEVASPSKPKRSPDQGWNKEDKAQFQKAFAKGGKIEAEPIKGTPEPLEYEEIKDDDDKKPKNPIDYEPMDAKAMADGGDSSDDQQPMTININPGQMASDNSPLINPTPGSIAAARPGAITPANPINDLPYGVTPEQYVAMQQQAQQAQKNAVMPTSQPQAPSKPAPEASSDDEKAPDGVPAPDAMSGYANQMQGIAQQAAAQGKLGQAEAGVLQGQIEQQKTAAQHYQEQYQALDDERQNFMQDVMNNHIDPNHYLNSMGTGDKIKTGIGLILGGMGGALTHQGNPALAFLNNQIDRDIQSQQANLGKSKSLLEANLRQFGNLHDATAMTKIMQTDIVANQLRMEAAKAQTPLAKAAALQAAGQLQMSVAPMFQQLAMRKALMAGGAQNADPAQFVPYVVPEGQQKEVFAEIKNAQNASKNSDEIMRKFDEATKENTALRTGFGHLRTPASVMEMNALFLPMIHDAEGRVNEFEQKTLGDLIPAPGDTDSKVQAKRHALQAFINQKTAAPTAKGFGIDLNAFRSTSMDPLARMSPQAQAFGRWARANSDHPKAKIVMQKLGIQ